MLICFCLLLQFLLHFKKQDVIVTCLEMSLCVYYVFGCLLFPRLTTKPRFDVKLKCNAKARLGGENRKMT